MANRGTIPFTPDWLSRHSAVKKLRSLLQEADESGMRGDHDVLRATFDGSEVALTRNEVEALLERASLNARLGGLRDTMTRTFTFTVTIGRTKDKTARRELDRVDAALGWKVKGGTGRVEAIRDLQRRAGVPVLERVS